MEPGLAELTELESILDAAASLGEVQRVGEATAGGRRFPIYALLLGDARRTSPAVGFFGGVHGLERIGTQVVLAFLGSLLARLRWDGALRRQLDSLRLVFMPLINPAGMWRSTRCNPQGVDLMRNAPLDAEEPVAPLLGGQRFSRRLPWYRGRAGAAMEVESEAVCRIVDSELLAHDFSLALDCHSGFGMRDRIWFPYARTRRPIEHLPEIHALKSVFDRCYPHHTYVFEPQSRQYLAHGDLWDYLYERARSAGDRLFLPLTLEMGSWLWVRKCPQQLFSRCGLFNPLPPHRLQRVLHGHLLWLDFLLRAADSCRHWLPTGSVRAAHRQEALARWYRGGHT